MVQAEYTAMSASTQTSGDAPERQQGSEELLQQIMGAAQTLVSPARVRQPQAFYMQAY